MYAVNIFVPVPPVGLFLVFVFVFPSPRTRMVGGTSTVRGWVSTNVLAFCVDVIAFATHVPLCVSLTQYVSECPPPYEVVVWGKDQGQLLALATRTSCVWAGTSAAGHRQASRWLKRVVLNL